MLFGKEDSSSSDSENENKEEEEDVEFALLPSSKYKMTTLTLLFLYRKPTGRTVYVKYHRS
jgi:hypothetical protein